MYTGMGLVLFKKAGVNEMNTIIEYVLCYATAFFLGFATALGLVYWVISYARNNTK